MKIENNKNPEIHTKSGHMGYKSGNFTLAKKEGSSAFFSSMFFIFMVFFVFLFCMSEVFACGLSPGKTTIYIYPDQATSWTVTILMDDNNNDSYYESTTSIRKLYDPELEWASLSPDNFTQSINISSTTSSYNVGVYINISKGISVGQHYFEVYHLCEPSGGARLGAISQAVINVKPYLISGLTANVSQENKSNLILRWDLFNLTNIDKLVVLRNIGSNVTIQNHEYVEKISELSPDSTSYEIENAEVCRQDVNYAVYGYLNGRLVATSQNVKNPIVGCPLPFLSTSPLNDSTLNSTSVLFEWENTTSIPESEIYYNLYISKDDEFKEALVFENLTSTSYFVGGLDNGFYYWKVYAYSKDYGFGIFSGTKGFAINDYDSDGVYDDVDNCRKRYNPDQIDSDSDGIGDLCDNCPTNYNPEQTDSDGDLKGDACDICPLDFFDDKDGDGICANFDNCPNNYNPEQTDSNGDGVGNICEAGNGYLWVTDYDSRKAYKINPQNGEVLGNFSLPDSIPIDIEWDGKYFYVIGDSVKKIFKLNETGDVISKFYTPTTSYHRGLVWNGSIFFVVSGMEIYVINERGEKIASKYISDGSGGDISYDGSNPWLHQGNINRVDKLDENLTTIANIPVPATGGETGLCWDGRYLWMAESDSKKIYQFSRNGNVLRNILIPNFSISGLGWQPNSSEVCYDNSACGADGYVGDSYCYKNDLYQDYESFNCTYPGTLFAKCSALKFAKKKEECGADYCDGWNKYCVGNSSYHNRTCYDKGCASNSCYSNPNYQEEKIEDCSYGCDEGVCAVCSLNSHCGNDSWVGEAYCNGNEIWQNYTSYTCENPGKANSACSANTAPQLKQACNSGEVCYNASCVTPVCSAESDCGTDGYIGNEFCIGNGVYKTYRNYSCINPGQYNAVCSYVDSNVSQKNCFDNQQCSNGVCVDIKTEVVCQKAFGIPTYYSTEPTKEKCSSLDPVGKYSHYSWKKQTINMLGSKSNAYQEICVENPVIYYYKWHSKACKQSRCPKGFNMTCESRINENGKVVYREKCENPEAIYTAVNNCKLGDIKIGSNGESKPLISSMVVKDEESDD